MNAGSNPGVVHLDRLSLAQGLTTTAGPSFKIMQLLTLRVYYTHSVIRVKNVGGGRVVDDDYLVQLSAEAAEVFDVVSAVEDARLAEEARVEHVPLVQQIGHGVRVLQSKG